MKHSAATVPPAPHPADARAERLEDGALGMISTRSYPAIVGTADMMVKSADVSLVGFEKTGGGFCTAIVRGNTADVRLAVEEGAKTAEQFGQLVAKLVMARPMPNLEAVFPIGTRMAVLARQRRGYSRLSNHAIGLLETRGFPAMVGGADAMLKSADVQLASYETIGDGLCTAIVRGTVSNVAVAVEAGMAEAERIGELHAVMVIPRLLDDLEGALPVAECWLERPEPLPALESRPQQQPLHLPELEKVPLQLEQGEAQELEVQQAQQVPEPVEAKPVEAEPVEAESPDPLESESLD